jgi:exosortase
MIAAPLRMRRFVTTLLVLALVLLALAPATRALAQLWLDTDATTYTHGFLVAGLCLWLLWRAEPRAVPAPTGIQAAGIVAGLLVALLAWRLLSLAGIQTAQLALLPPILWAAVWLTQGPAVARASAFGIGYLYFAIPVWSYLNGAAQEGTVIAVRWLLRITGITAHVEGNIVHIPEGTFEIEGGCSGLHFLIVALALGALLGQVRHDGWRARLRWLGLALGLAVLTNWIRVYTIILLGHLTDMQHYVVRVSHYGYGWLLFAVAMALLLYIEYRTALPGAPARTGAGVSGGTPAAWKIAAAAAVLLPSMLGRVIDARTPDSVAAPVPAGAAGCWQPIGGASSWSPVQHGADSLVRHRYRCGDAEIESLVATYRNIEQGRELGGFDNRPGGGALVVATRRVERGAQAFEELEVTGAQGRALVWVHYQVAGRQFASATRAQLWHAAASLCRLRAPGARVHLLHSACTPGCDTARDRMRQYLTDTGAPE